MAPPFYFFVVFLDFVQHDFEVKDNVENHARHENLLEEHTLRCTLDQMLEHEN